MFEVIEQILCYIIIALLALFPVTIIGLFIYILYQVILERIRLIGCKFGKHYDYGGCRCSMCGKRFRPCKYKWETPVFPAVKYAACVYCGGTINHKDEEIGCSRGHIGLIEYGRCMFCYKYVS